MIPYNIDSIQDDFYSIIDLLGMSGLPEEKKQKVLNDMFISITREFFSEKLSEIKKIENLLFIQRLLKDKKDLKIILQYIADHIPNLLNSLITFTIEKKYEIIQTYFEDMTQALEKKILILSNSSAKIVVKNRLELYRKASLLAKNRSWNELQSFMKQYSRAL